MASRFAFLSSCYCSHGNVFMYLLDERPAHVGAETSARSAGVLMPAHMILPGRLW